MAKKEKCPICGKPVVEVRRYRGDDKLYIHKKKLMFGGGGLVPFYDISDSCFVPGTKEVKLQ